MNPSDNDVFSTTTSMSRRLALCSFEVPTTNSSEKNVSSTKRRLPRRFENHEKGSTGKCKVIDSDRWWDTTWLSGESSDTKQSDQNKVIISNAREETVCLEPSAIDIIVSCPGKLEGENIGIKKYAKTMHSDANRKGTSVPRRNGVYSSKVPTMNLSDNDVSSTTTRMSRRFALCSFEVPTMNSSEKYACLTKRRLPRRFATIKNHEKGSTGKCNVVPSDKWDTVWLLGKRSDTIQSDQNEEIISNVREEIAYLEPSTTDIIVSSPGNLQGEGIGIKKYVETMYSDTYRKAENETERSLIVYTILNNIKDRGSKFLEESLSCPGAYFEVDDWYSLRKIEEVFQEY